MAGRWQWICMVIIIAACLTGCKGDTKEKKVSDLDYTVVSPQDMTEELVQHIEEKKAEQFTFIYKDGEHMYLVAGYGEQTGGGYSIQVQDMYMGESAVYVQISLIGPTDEAKSSQGLSYPFIVLEIETTDCPVIFDM